MSNTSGVLQEAGTAYPLLANGSPPPGFGVVRVTHLFSLLCFVFHVLFVFVLWLVYPKLSVSLDCPFLIFPSVFSNVYSFKLSRKYSWYFHDMKKHTQKTVYVNMWYWDTVMNEYFALMGSIDCPVSVLTTTTSHKRLLSILIFVQSWQRVVP